MCKKVLIGILTVAALVVVAAPAIAQDAPTTEELGSTKSANLLGLAIAFGIALAAFGGAMGQGRATSAAVEAVARQPEAGGRIQTMMIIGLALIETLVLYTLLIAFMMMGKVPG